MLHSKNEEKALFIPLLPFALTTSYRLRLWRREWSRPTRAAELFIYKPDISNFRERVEKGLDGESVAFTAAPSAYPWSMDLFFSFQFSWSSVHLSPWNIFLVAACQCRMYFSWAWHCLCFGNSAFSGKQLQRCCWDTCPK